MIIPQKIKVILIIISLVATAASKEMSITKIEPPNWWAGMKNDRIQLMIYGGNLDINDASFNTTDIKIEKIYTLENKDYAFIDIRLSAMIKPDNYTLTVKNKLSETDFIFPVLQRDESLKRNRGFDASDVIYLITPDRFVNGDTTNDVVEGMGDELNREHDYRRHGGDIQGIINKLDYLRDLGVTALWINPLTENKMRSSYHGYATTDCYKIDPRFGSNELYKNLVGEAHKRDLKIIIDHVSNHIGINHPWIKNLPTADWLNDTFENHKRAAHKKAVMFDIHSDPNIKSYMTDGWFSRGMPDLNQKNEFVANYIIQNTIWWMEFSGLDGIREDTYPYPDQQFLANWAAAILMEYPASNIVGEVWDYSAPTLAWFQKGSYLPREFDSNLPSVTDFVISKALTDYVTGDKELDVFYYTFSQDHIYPNPYNLVTFMDNHDIPRIVLRAGGLSERLKIAFHLLLTTRGIPQIYYGTEIGIVGGNDHGSLREDFPGGFPGDKHNAFNKEERSDYENAFFNELQSLLKLRKKYPALAQGKMIHFYPYENIYVYLKIYKEQKILIAVNGGDSDAIISQPGLENYMLDVKKLVNIKSGLEMEKAAFAGFKLAPLQVGMFLLE